MTVLLCRLTGPTLGALRSAIAEGGAEIPCRPVAIRTPDGVATNVLLDGEHVQRLRSARGDIRVDVLDEPAAPAARELISSGGRYRAGEVPRGVGRKV